MPDHFEAAKDKILRDAQENGGVTPYHLLDALSALAEDNDEYAEAATTDRKTMKVSFDRHCTEAMTLHREHEDRFEDIERWRSGLSADLCAQHREIHEDHVREMHAIGLTDEEGEPVARRVWLMWLVGSKVTYVFIAVIVTAINILLNWLWMGAPQGPTP